MPDIKNRILPLIERARGSLDRKELANTVTDLRSAAALLQGGSAYMPRIDAIENEYYYMLRFIASGNDVDNLDDTLERLSLECERIARGIELDVAAEADLTVFSGQLRYVRRRPEETLASLVSDYLAELDKVNADTGALTDTRKRAGLERISSDIFSRLWVEFPVSSDSSALLASLFDDSSIPFYDRVLWVHALGLSALNYPDRDVTELLHAAHGATDNRVSTAAAIWLVFAKDNSAANIARMNSEHPYDALSVYLEFARSLSADTLSNNYNDSLGPRLNDLGRRMSDKLSGVDPDKIGDVLSDPSWLGSDIESKDFDSIRDFAQAQANGDDVFAATLGRMRSFEFFNTLPNWFLPFHTAHSMLAPVVDGEGAMIADAIAQMPILCDSDKYALVLSMTQMPAGMREMALTQMSQQFQQLSNTEELAQAIDSAGKPSRRWLINNHIKNIYRFFKLFKTRNEFDNVFERDLDYTALYRDGGESNENLLALADELFRSRHYAQALKVYDNVLSGNITDPSKVDSFSEEQLLRAAEAAKQTRQTMRAEVYYDFALRRNPGNINTAMKIAALHLDDGTPVGGLRVLEPFLGDNTDNPGLLRLAGALFEMDEEWEEALNIYHNLDYILPEDDNSAKGLLAKALLFNGDYVSALPLFEAAPATADLAYYHSLALWLSGDRKKALDVFAIPDEGVVLTVPEALADLPAAKSFGLVEEMNKYREDGRPM